MKSHFRKKNVVLPIENFSSSVLSRNAMMLQHLIKFPLYNCQVIAYGKLKTKENFKLLALKVVAIAYERRSVTRGSKYSDLTWELLVFWKTGRWGEVVATGSSTVEKAAKILFAWRHLAHIFRARPDHVWVKSLSSCFVTELVSFICFRYVLAHKSTWS